MNAEDRSRRQRGALIGLALLLFLTAVVLIVILLNLLQEQPGGFAPQRGIEPVGMIAGPGRGEEPLFGRPMGAAFSPEGLLYVTDADYNRVCVFDSKGHFLFEFGGLGITKPLPGAVATWRPGLMNYPVGIDVDQDGQVYVADFRNDQIQVFSADGSFIRAFPDPKSVVGRGGSGQDSRGIAVTDVCVKGDEVYATDVYQVFVFDREGNLKRQFGRPGKQEGGLDHPNGIAVGDRVVYVADSNHSRVQAFTSSGNPLWTTGSPAESLQPTTASDFSLPRGMAVLDDGSLLVADAFQFAIVELAPDGKVTARYGDQGQMPGQLLFPNDVDALGSLVAVADKDNRRVQLVRLVGDNVR